jgi:PHD/YefM family antitoxin component YafN of YafNO toxin-antitoxin module
MPTLPIDRQEVIPVSKAGRNLGRLLDELKKGKREKFILARNNDLEAVLVPIEVYEKMQEAEELVDDLEIALMVKERETRDTGRRLRHADIKKKYGL